MRWRGTASGGETGIFKGSCCVCKQPVGSVILSVQLGPKMVKLAPTVTLSNGFKFPIIGLGTWKSKPGEVEQAVKDAIDAGYRHIDGAFIYGNEKEVGQGIKAKIAEGVIKREDIFLTTKLWNTFHRKDLVQKAMDLSLKNLGLDYVDLYLIHWPFAYKEDAELFPRDADGKIIPSDADFLDTYKELEKLVEKGQARSIGISNFNKEQVERVIKNAKIKPVVNQVECHPYLNQKDLIAYCKSQDIVVTAYSPLGSPDRPWAKPGDPQLLDDPKIKAIAQKYNKTPAQIVLRYLIQHGTIPIPKSVTKSRIQENFQVFDFEISAEDVATIDSFDCNGRLCVIADAKTFKLYPF